VGGGGKKKTNKEQTSFVDLNYYVNYGQNQWRSQGELVKIQLLLLEKRKKIFKIAKVFELKKSISMGSPDHFGPPCYAPTNLPKSLKLDEFKVALIKKN